MPPTVRTVHDDLRPQLNSFDSYLAAFLSNKLILRFAAAVCAPITAAAANQTARGTAPTPARPRFRSMEEASSLFVTSPDSARRASACSFSMERTRILSCPCSIARTVCSRYATFFGCVMAVSMSLARSPVAVPKTRSCLARGVSLESCSDSMKGCANLARSYSGSSPLPMPSTDAKARKMKVNVEGKRKTCCSVNACRSAPSVVLMLDAALPCWIPLKVRMK
mmetsp:Transcript_20311/g.64688  ORF Transcript_20311/g.64688 Transcript_20311/m.64688 type:complete len:223 (-) Transcript_20311:1662-2330(-)